MADYLENGGTVAHTFCFGPGLVIDGVVRDEFDSRMDNGPKTLAQRMIFGQITPMEFVILCTEGPESQSPKSIGFDLWGAAKLGGRVRLAERLQPRWRFLLHRGAEQRED